MQHRQIYLPALVCPRPTLDSVQFQMAEGTGSNHCIRALVLCFQGVGPAHLQTVTLVGVEDGETAAFALPLRRHNLPTQRRDRAL